jgi:phosphoglycolate phosphatase
LLLCAERIGTGDRRAVLIGDSIADVKAARNAHMPCILVRGGYTNTAPELLGADVVIDSFDHLFTALEQLAA